VWALGVTLCEALTQQQPTGLREGDMLLPPQMSATFRGVVARCLNRRAKSRPTVKELQVWSHGAQLVASLSASGSYASLPDAMESGEPPSSVASSARTFMERHWMWLGLAVILGALVLFVTSWAAIRRF
jgi:hypothetical protein